ncbi:hypothetical protein GCM10017673_35230 [Streptosporangium violaceochromogenes]|nr:hypothetical protein GCM10017673_35230 [Streptosporangium violaceochromogenes]
MRRLGTQINEDRRQAALSGAQTGDQPVPSVCSPAPETSQAVSGDHSASGAVVQPLVERAERVVRSGDYAQGAAAVRAAMAAKGIRA